VECEDGVNDTIIYPTPKTTAEYVIQLRDHNQWLRQDLTDKGYTPEEVDNGMAPSECWLAGIEWQAAREAEGYRWDRHGNVFDPSGQLVAP